MPSAITRSVEPYRSITFERIAVTRDQVEEWNLPTRPTKKSDSRSKNFVGDSVELDAIAPGQLRDLVREVIERHMTPSRLAQLRKEEAAERQKLREMIASLR